MKCSRCGKSIPNTAKFCRYCGARAMAAPPQRSAAPNGRPARGGGRQSGGNGFLVLRIILIVLCVGLVGIGIWKIPGNVRTILDTHARSVEKKLPFGKPGRNSAQHTGLTPEEQAAVHEEIARIDAQQELPEPTLSEEEEALRFSHAQSKNWFYVEQPEPTEEVDAP